MNLWYAVKVKYIKKVEKNGQEEYKKVNETFLLPAVSFTDAESRITKEIGKSAEGEFFVHAMSVKDVTEIIRNEEGGQWYNVKIEIQEEDENGKVSKTKQNYMVESMSTKSANKSLDERLSDAMFSYEVTTVSKTNIMDVFYEDLDVEISREPAV